MFSLFIIGLLLVILIGTTSRIVQAQLILPEEIDYYSNSRHSEKVGILIRDCDGNIVLRGTPTQFQDIQVIACN